MTDANAEAARAVGAAITARPVARRPAAIVKGPMAAASIALVLVAKGSLRLGVEAPAAAIVAASRATPDADSANAMATVADGPLAASFASLAGAVTMVGRDATVLTKGVALLLPAVAVLAMGVAVLTMGVTRLAVGVAAVVPAIPQLVQGVTVIAVAVTVIAVAVTVLAASVTPLGAGGAVADVSTRIISASFSGVYFGRALFTSCTPISTSSRRSPRQRPSLDVPPGVGSLERSRPASYSAALRWPDPRVARVRNYASARYWGSAKTFRLFITSGVLASDSRRMAFDVLAERTRNTGAGAGATSAVHAGGICPARNARSSTSDA
jgi:hypothetical protein